MPPPGSAQGHAYVARTRLPLVATSCRIAPVC